MAVVPERSLSRRELNRALLARQLLLERAELPLPRALERVAGLQAQYAPAMYVGLWSRLRRFQRDDLTRALERRSVVQGTLMRVTIHLVSARDYWPLAVAIRESRRRLWLRAHRASAEEREMEAAARTLRETLAGGTLRQAEIDQLVGRQRARGVGLWLDLVRVPPSGTWERRRADVYAAAEDWLGPADVSFEDGLVHLVRRYLGGFGPAPRTDVANWAGLPVRELSPALERMRLRRFRGPDGEELLDLPGAPLPDLETPVPVRFLPVWDATLLVHARRTGILPERYRPLVFNTKTPHSVSTFLVDGAVAGTWRYERDRIAVEPFERLAIRVQRGVVEEAERVASFHS